MHKNKILILAVLRTEAIPTSEETLTTAELRFAMCEKYAWMTHSQYSSAMYSLIHNSMVEMNPCDDDNEKFVEISEKGRQSLLA